MNTLNGSVYLVAGGGADVDGVVALLAREGIEVEGNPDAYVRRYASFGIDDAHELIGRAAARAFGARRIFIVYTDSMTTEAQNALLKTLEEPAGDALFFFIVPSPEMLLSTFRSRAQILSCERAPFTGANGEGKARAFLEASEAKRLELLKPLLEKSDEEKRDLGAIIAFLASLERLLADDAKKADVREGIEAVYCARKFIGDRGALAKPLLEHVALLLPRM